MSVLGVPVSDILFRFRSKLRHESYSRLAVARGAGRGRDRLGFGGGLWVVPATKLIFAP